MSYNGFWFNQALHQVMQQLLLVLYSWTLAAKKTSITTEFVRTGTLTFF